MVRLMSYAEKRMSASSIRQPSTFSILQMPKRVDNLVRLANLPQFLERHPLYMAVQQCHAAADVVHCRPTRIERLSQSRAVKLAVAVHHPIAICICVER